MSIKDFFFGSKGKTKKKPTMSPEQEAFLRSIYEGPGIEASQGYQDLSDYYRRLYSNDPQARADYEAPYRQNFEQQTVPMIAERFAGMGTGAGGLNSSALYNSLAQAGRNLESDLASQRAQLQGQSAGQYQNFSQSPYDMKMQGLQYSPYAYFSEPGTSGLIPEVLKGIASGGAAGAGYGAMNFAANRFMGNTQAPQAVRPGAGYGGY